MRVQALRRGERIAAFSLASLASLASLSYAAFVVIALTGCGAPASAASHAAAGPLVSRPCPEFRRQALDGSVVETGSLRGRVVLVDFFAEHCAPCARSLPSIEALHRAMPDVAVLGVSEDEDATGAGRMVERHGLTFPVVLDEGHALAGRFRVTDIPATFVVDARGVVRWQGGGEDGEDVGAVVRSVR
jgi:peroxiredoxin